MCEGSSALLTRRVEKPVTMIPYIVASQTYIHMLHTMWLADSPQSYIVQSSGNIIALLHGTIVALRGSLPRMLHCILSPGTCLASIVARVLARYGSIQLLVDFGYRIVAKGKGSLSDGCQTGSIIADRRRLERLSISCDKHLALAMEG
jgi:hypothetical protein